MDVERRSLEARIDLLEARSDALESEAVEMWERAEKAEAAIQRVRAIQPIPVGDFNHPGWNACLAAVHAALRGDSDE